MIFEQDSIAFKILDVLYFEQKDVKTNITKRNFDALSFRFEADSVIKLKNEEIKLTDNSISFFPSEISYTRTAKKDKMIVIHFKTFNYNSQKLEYLYPDNFEKYAKLFKKIFDIWNAKLPSYKYECAAILNNIFAEIYKSNKNLNEDKKSKISESIQYIKSNCLKKDFSLQTAAKKSFISESYFRKIFSEEFGMSPKKYVIEHRIKYAASLIIAGYFSLQEISQMCGYDDYKHFSSAFKKIMNVSPSKYTYKF